MPYATGMAKFAPRQVSDAHHCKLIGKTGKAG